jgi:hypothetical protein
MPPGGVQTGCMPDLGSNLRNQDATAEQMGVGYFLLVKEPMAGADVFHFSVRILPPIMNRAFIVSKDLAYVISVNADV